MKKHKKYLQVMINELQKHAMPEPNIHHDKCLIEKLFRVSIKISRDFTFVAFF